VSVSIWRFGAVGIGSLCSLLLFLNVSVSSNKIEELISKLFYFLLLFNTFQNNICKLKKTLKI